MSQTTTDAADASADPQGIVTRLRRHAQGYDLLAAAAGEIERLRAALAAAEDVIYALELGLGNGEKWTAERMAARDVAVIRHKEALWT